MYAKNQTANITNTHEVEEEEYAKFLEFLDKEEANIFSLFKQQKDRPLDSDPLFTSHELEVKQKEIEKRVRTFRIRSKRKPKIVKLNVTETNEKESDEGVKENEGEPAHTEESESSQHDHHHEQQQHATDENTDMFDEL